MSKSVRIDDDLHEWIFDNYSKRKSISDVIRELKEFWEQHQDKITHERREDP